MNGLLMFLASSNRYKKLSIIAMIGWIAFMFSRANFSLGYIFPLINIGVFVLVANISRFWNNKEFNKIYSVFSILIWSICIDTVCYFIFPQMIFGQSLVQYIVSGIAFNSRLVIYNILNLFILEGTVCISKKINLVKNKTITDRYVANYLL